MILAGEASGDAHGARVAREIRRRWPAVEMVGLGGERMAAVFRQPPDTPAVAAPYQEDRRLRDPPDGRRIPGNAPELFPVTDTDHAALLQV